MSLLFFLASTAFAGIDHPPGILPPVLCGTPQLMGLDHPEPIPEPLTERPKSGKLVRDAYGITANELFTDNFVFRWGSSGGVTEREIERLADAFEDAWLEEVDIQGHPAPYGTDDYYFNIYIGSSGGGTPTDGGAAGYFTSDPSGWPMVVVGAGTLDNPEYADITAAHEFYHAIQAGAARYGYSGDSAWFWEASATWASATVYPSNLYYASFLFSYAYLPHYAANYFNYPTSGALDEYYQYGAFILPLHLSEITADRELIRDVWAGDDPERDPLSTIQRLLEDRGQSFDDAFMDHASRMVTFDYPEGSNYDYFVSYYDSYYRESDNQVAAEVGPEGTGGLVDGPSDLRPYRYGYNAIEIDIGDATRLDITVEGDSTGDRGSAAEWGARLVVVDRRDRTYHEVSFSGDSGTASLDGLDGETVWLVVGVWSDETRFFDTEQYSYQYSVAFPSDDEPGDPGDEPEDSGSADSPSTDDDDGTTDSVDGDSGDSKASTCSAVTASGAWALVLGAAAVAGRRRKQRDR